MPRTDRDFVPRPGVLERLRHPSRRARVITFLAIWFGSSIYLATSAVVHDRGLLPKSHDEQSYAIQTQMVARGKLWMPQHELADFFDTFQMLARPVYASIYFPGSALMYAPGVWLALPPWVMPALVSGLAVSLAYVLATRLIDGFGGLLMALLLLACQWFRLNGIAVMSQSPMAVLGLAAMLAWLRWRETKGMKWAAAVGACAGWAAVVRPVDALAFAAPVGVAMLIDFRGLPLRRIGATCGAVLMAATPFLSLQLVLNKGTTGRWLTAPHTLYLQRDQPQTTYGFHAPDPQSRPQSTLPQKRDYYALFMLPDVRRHQFTNLGSITVERLKRTIGVALPSKLLLPFLVAGLFAVRDPRRVVIAAVPGVFFVLYLPYTFYMTHYVIPVMPPLLLLVLFGAQRLAALGRTTEARERAGLGLAALLAVVALSCLPELNPRVGDDMIFAPKTRLLHALIDARVGAPAVVLVRYHPGENTHDEPVYNTDVPWPDEAPVILAHDLGPRNLELLAYYERTQPGRRYYLFDRVSLKLQGPGTAADLARAIKRARAAPATTQRND